MAAGISVLAAADTLWRCTPAPRTALGFVQGTRTLHTELAPGNPGCSRRFVTSVLDVCAPRVLYNTP
eukprot:4123767-Pyramimonas_sp.AAC.1